MAVKDKKVGKQTIKLENPPKIISTYSIVGPKEGDGPLKDYFHEIISDDTLGKDSFEKAESEMMYTAIKGAISAANLTEEKIDYLFAGDLLNQITSSSFAARELNIPFIGLYGACSTMSESLSMASLFLDGGFGSYIVASTSSHFSAAERQFRFTTGLVKDYGIKDANNMGAAMAPAAVDTIYNHFKDTGRTPKDYDIIATGDLGKVGKEITTKLLAEYGYDVKDNYIDCGDMIFDDERQKTDSGGSGCGCSAVVTCGYLYKKLMRREIKSVLLVSTGALMSTTSSLQGESIPGIAHAVAIEF